MLEKSHKVESLELVRNKNNQLRLSDEVTCIAVDAEWSDNKFLCIQLAASDRDGNIKGLYVFTDDLLSINQCPDIYKGIPVVKELFPIGVKGVIEAFDYLPKTLTCYFFYSPRDIEGLLGKVLWKELLIGNKVNKNRNLNIQPLSFEIGRSNESPSSYQSKSLSCNISFRDLSGRFGCGLEAAYKIVGMNTTDGKDYIKMLNINKSRMDLFRVNYPEEFYRYSLGDLELHTLALRLRSMMSEVIEESFGISKVYETLEEYPKSIGSLVNDIFSRYLHKEYPEVLKACCLMSTTPNDKAVNDLKRYRNWIDNGYNCYKVSKLLEKNKSIVHGLGMCSIPAFFSGHYGLNDTSPYGAVVQGGRAIREETKEYLFKDVADIDLQSAYGSKLREFDYPFGLPTVFSVGNADESGGPTLKEFLKNYRDELIEGLYVIYVSGNLSHKQDLVFSKYGLNSAKIGGKILSQNYSNEEDDDSRLGGKFLLTTKQIELGIITSHVLEIIEKISNTREYKEWMNLEVKLAVYYPKSKEMSIEEWGDFHSKRVNIGVFNPQEDKRSRHWCRLSLEKFIGTIIDKRLYYKSNKNDNPIYDCKQQLLKLIINAVYGDLASPFFPMGNTVVANNITAAVRVGSWLMSKALGTKITVTDGGIYTPHSVPKFKTHIKGFRKPSLSTLYLKNCNWIKFVEYIDLLPESLSSLVNRSNAQELLDELTLEHIKRFCELYNIKFNFNIEHKLENSGHLSVTNPYGKVDYIIYTYDNKEIVKIRGVRSAHYNKHSKVEFMRKLALQSTPEFFGCIIDETIGVNDYLNYHFKYEDNLPGYVIDKEYIHKPHHKAGILFDTYDDFCKAEHAHVCRVRKYDKANINIPIMNKPSFLTSRLSIL